MGRNNNRTNTLIKWLVTAGDFVLLNVLILLFRWQHPYLQGWDAGSVEVLWAVCNLAAIVAQWKYGTIIHLRVVSGGEILRRVFCLAVLQTVVTYILMKAINTNRPVGWLLLELGICWMGTLLVVRVIERSVIKHCRQQGRNTRTAVFVGADPEFWALYRRLQKNPTYGYRLIGYYADTPMPKSKYGERAEDLQRLGTLKDLMQAIADGQEVCFGDDLFVCLSRSKGETVRALAAYCDQHVIRFYFVPKSVESLGMHLRRESFDDLEVFTSYASPMEVPVNKWFKRCFDVVVSAVVLLCLLPLLPVVALIIKLQSPGPLFFTQERTGLNGKNFRCYKFRSMHVNTDADRIQATEEDPRKFPFGSFMRKFSIDELPQFWNVLRGDMSIVGPRPHMLYHTELYKQQLGNYMVRHFVKPGITGWAQVTGFRGETKELWQMGERVKRDIWYIEHWSFWLDVRIIWMTVKSVLSHDDMAY